MKINQTNRIAVKTHDDISQRKDVSNITCRGEAWGPLECSLQVDGIGKESLDTDMEPYKYRDEIEIPVLGWIDDIIKVSETGYMTARMNSIINAQLATEQLRLGTKKCYTLHIGKQHKDYKHVPLFVDGWKVQTVESYDSNETRRDRPR